MAYPASHKTDAQRALVSARQKLMMIMEDEDDPPSEAMTTKLEEVDNLIRKAETGTSAGNRRLTLPMAQMLEDFQKQASSDLPESKAWLVHTFTKHMEMQSTEQFQNFDHQGASGSEGLPREGRKRSTCQEFEARLATLCATPEGNSLMSCAEDFTFAIMKLNSLPAVVGKPLTVLATHLLQKGLRDAIRSDPRLAVPADALEFEAKLYQYFEEIESMYLDSPYHDNKHGADVMMTTAWFCRTPFFQAGFSVLDQLACVVASAVHDFGHPGKNNDYQVNTRSALALRYNDKSVLENMHAALSFEIMQQRPECDWFSMVQTKFEGKDGQVVNTQKYLRKCIVAMVLSTDMTMHSEHVKELKTFINEKKGESELMADGKSVESAASLKDKKLEIMCCLIHAADISNPVKGQPVMLQWTEKILEEFWKQGDEERAMGLPISPLCDRNGADVPQGQLGFLQFVIDPFWRPLSVLIPECQEAVDNMKANKEFWQEMKEKKASLEDIFSS